MIRPLRTVLRIFVTGALAALPLAATLLIFVWAGGVLIRWLGPDSASAACWCRSAWASAPRRWWAMRSASRSSRR